MHRAVNQHHRHNNRRPGASWARVGIRVILTKHENCAGFMAEGVHHHDGAPAILVATIGPGIANAANVIANATQDRVPLIVLTGCVSAVHQHTYTHQVDLPGFSGHLV